MTTSGLADAFDMKALRLQAYDYAALVSPLIQDENGATIGPAKLSPATKQTKSSEKSKRPVIRVPSPTPTADDSFDVSLDTSDAFDVSIQEIAQNLYNGEMEKLRREIAKQEWKRRSDAQQKQEHEYRQKVTCEIETIDREKTQLLQQAYDRRVQEALLELSQQEQRFAEEDAKRLQAIAQRKEARQDLLRRQAEQAKMHQYLDEIQKNQKEIRACLENYSETVNAVDAELKAKLREKFDARFGDVVQRNSQIVKSGQVNAEVVAKSTEMRKSAEQLFIQVGEEIQSINKSKSDALAAAAAAASAAAAAATAAAAVQEAQKLAAQQQHEQQPPPPVAAASPASSDLSQTISAGGQAIYSQVEQYYMNHLAQIKELAVDASFKAFRYRVKVALMPLINMISASTLREQLQKIEALFAGGPVAWKSSTFSANEHPQGLPYCKVFMAEYFVRCEHQNNIASYAAAIVALSQRHPDFYQLFRYHLYKAYPTMVPFFIPQYEGQSQEQYERALGYRDGERGTEFVKRVAAIAKLYATIIVSASPQPGAANPFTLEEGWRWLVDVVRMEPLVAVSGSILGTFLDVAGPRMQQAYGRQFAKLLRAVKREYLPKLRLIDSATDLHLVTESLNKF